MLLLPFVPFLLSLTCDRIDFGFGFFDYYIDDCSEVVSKNILRDKIYFGEFVYALNDYNNYCEYMFYDIINEKYKKTAVWLE